MLVLKLPSVLRMSCFNIFLQNNLQLPCFFISDKAMSDSENFRTYLKRKVVTMLRSLENEVDDMRKTMFNMEDNVEG